MSPANIRGVPPRAFISVTADLAGSFQIKNHINAWLLIQGKKKTPK